MSDGSADVGGGADASCAELSAGNWAPEPGIHGAQEQLLNTEQVSPQAEGTNLMLGALNVSTHLYDKGNINERDDKITDQMRRESEAQQPLAKQSKGTFATNDQSKRKESPLDVQMENYLCTKDTKGDAHVLQQGQDGRIQTHECQRNTEHGMAFIMQEPSSKPNDSAVEERSRDLTQHDVKISRESSPNTSSYVLDEFLDNAFIQSLDNIKESEPEIGPQQLEEKSNEAQVREDAVRCSKSTPAQRTIEGGGNKMQLPGPDQPQERVYQCIDLAKDDHDHVFDNFTAHAHQLRDIQYPYPSTFHATESDRVQGQRHQQVSDPAGCGLHLGHEATSSPLNPNLIPQSHQSNSPNQEFPIAQGEGSSHEYQKRQPRADINPLMPLPRQRFEINGRRYPEQYQITIGRHRPQQHLRAGYQGAQQRTPQVPGGHDRGSRIQGSDVNNPAPRGSMVGPGAHPYTYSGDSRRLHQEFPAKNAKGYSSSGLTRISAQDRSRKQESLTSGPGIEYSIPRRDNRQAFTLPEQLSSSKTNSIGAGYSRQKLSTLAAGQSRNDHSGGYHNYFYGPHMSPAGTPNRHPHGVQMYGQSPMSFSHAQGPPHGRHPTGTFEPNAGHPYLPHPWSYGPNAMPMTSTNPHFSAQTGHGYGMPSQLPTQPLQKSKSSTPSPMVRKRHAPEEASEEEDSEKQDDSSSDDEPLMKRAQIRVSKQSSHDLTDSTRGQLQGSSENKEDSGESVKLTLELINKPPQVKDEDAEDRVQDNDAEDQVGQKKVAPPPRALPKPVPIPTASDDDSDGSKINFKLPTYAVEVQPVDLSTEEHIVKVSLPNMVREELVLAPDYADQEIHLLKELFIPGQQALAAPDPEPTIATLNFHTITNMVLDAYATFEAGDQLTNVSRHNRGYPPSNFEHSDDEDQYEDEQKPDARDADIDEIFFAVIDRWRAGKASNKKSYSLIRGVQEFCDIALDLIYYIHENGLVCELNSDGERKSGKGTKRASRGQKADEDARVKRAKRMKTEHNASASGKGKAASKTAAAGSSFKSGKGKVNTLQPRKKLKMGVMVIQKD